VLADREVDARQDDVAAERLPQAARLENDVGQV
jgi:hypothetical protein